MRNNKNDLFMGTVIGIVGVISGISIAKMIKRRQTERRNLSRALNEICKLFKEFDDELDDITDELDIVKNKMKKFKKDVDLNHKDNKKIIKELEKIENSMTMFDDIYDMDEINIEDGIKVNGSPSHEEINDIKALMATDLYKKTYNKMKMNEKKEEVKETDVKS